MPDQLPPDGQLAPDADTSRESKRDAPAGTPKREVADDVVTTRHTLKAGRTSLEYTATAGRVVLREEVYDDGKFTGFQAKAEVSMTSYVVDGPGKRPVTFAFKGGPGSSSVWLHLGLL